MRPALALAATSVAVSLTAFASCADTEPISAPSIDASSTSEASSPDDADAADVRRGPCKAADPTTCTNEAVPCSATDFCPVETMIDPRYVVNAVWGSGASSVWVAGAQGTIARWDGSVFQVERTKTSYTLNAIWGASPDDLWAVSAPNVILHRTASGWNNVAPIATTRITNALSRSVWGSSRGANVVVGGDPLSGVLENEQVWISPRDNVEWSLLGGVPAVTVHGIWGSSDDDIWVVGDDHLKGGVALHHVMPSIDRMGNWTPTEIQGSNLLEAIWGSAPDDVWAVGTQGAIRHYRGEGERWDVVSSPTRQHLRAVWGTGRNDAWIAGDSGTLLHWDGTKWRRLVASFPVGPNPDLFGVWASAPNDAWAVGASGTVLHCSGIRTTDPGDAP